MATLPFEQFPALVRQEGLAHGFTQRVAWLDVKTDKAEALRRLDAVHAQVRAAIGLGGRPFLTAEQVHGNRIAVVAKETTAACFDGCDGLVTNRADVALGIYVADCCAVYLLDPVQRALGLVHSGKKGTELGIAVEAIDLMAKHYGSRPGDLVVQLGPCIRPPHYEIDFAAEIVRSVRERGVEQVHDGGTCTASELERYYSYRAEKGQTGRMLALLGWR